MGGWGSGRQAYATTPTVEACRSINADDLTDAVDHPGSTATMHWGDPEDPDASVAVRLEGDPDEDDRVPSLRLVYSVTDPRADETRERDYRVPLEYTECHFGGVRPWFRCPSVVDGEHCNQRVRKLYCPPMGDRFLCRECHGLKYRSSRTSGDDLQRAEDRYRKAFAKADAENRRRHPNSSEPPFFPERPKGMHEVTHEALLAEIEVAREEWQEAFDEKLREVAGAVEWVG